MYIFNMCASIGEYESSVSSGKAKNDTGGEGKKRKDDVVQLGNDELRI